MISRRLVVRRYGEDITGTNHNILVKNVVFLTNKTEKNKWVEY